MLFNENIDNWNDWGRVFQSFEAFTPLAKEIFRRNGIDFEPLSKLTFGTNGVFRSGKFVVKIFFPQDSGIDPQPDFENEVSVCQRMVQLGIPTPSLVAKGIIHDKYDFYYIITRYFDGKEARLWLTEASQEELVGFVKQLKQILDKLNRPADGAIESIDLIERAVTNFRLKSLSPKLQREICDRVRSFELTNFVLVHGDLTGENLLVDKDGNLTIIDCADACLAPYWYEWPPIVFELFHCRSDLLKLFISEFEETNESFIEKVLNGVCLHNFGADILRDAPIRDGLPPFEELSDVRKFLSNKLK